MPSTYQDAIREDLARLGLVGRYEPAQVEAWMRLEHGTLDGLSATQFRAEVAIAAHCIDAATPEENRALVASFGLDKVHCTPPCRHSDSQVMYEAMYGVRVVPGHGSGHVVEFFADTSGAAWHPSATCPCISCRAAVAREIPATVLCAWCDGTGRLTTGAVCDECHGTGVVMVGV